MLALQFLFGRDLANGTIVVGVRGILVDACLDHRAEMRDEALDRPGRGVAQRADRVALDLPRDVLERVDLVELGEVTQAGGKRVVVFAAEAGVKRKPDVMVVLRANAMARRGSADAGVKLPSSYRSW